MKVLKNRKSVAIIASAVLVLCLAVGGTLAWLVAESNEVKNTFTYGDIDLALDETLTDEKGQPVDEQGNPIPDGQNPKKTKDGNTYEMLPGEEYLKDPAVTVLAGNEACWLFVKLTEEGEATIVNPDGTTKTYGFDDYLEYTVADEWVQLKDAAGADVEGVYYRYVGEDTDNQGVTYKVLKEDKIAVKGEVTKEMLNALDNNGVDAATAKYPKLTVKGYAIQYSGFKAASDSDADKAVAAYGAWTAIEDQNKANN